MCETEQYTPIFHLLWLHGPPHWLYWRGLILTHILYHICSHLLSARSTAASFVLTNFGMTELPQNSTPILFSLHGRANQLFVSLAIFRQESNTSLLYPLSFQSHTSGLQVILLKLLSIRLETNVDTTVLPPVTEIYTKHFLKKPLLYKIHSQLIFITMCVRGLSII